MRVSLTTVFVFAIAIAGCGPEYSSFSRIRYANSDCISFAGRHFLHAC